MLKIAKNIVLTGIVLFLLFSLSKSIFSYQDKLKFYHEYRKEYESEKELNKRLKSDLKKSSDYYVVEKQVREKLNLLQPNETAIILPEITLTPTPTPEVIKSPPQQWFDLFFR